MEHEVIDHAQITALLAAPPSSEEPVVSIYLSTGTSTAERRLNLKNLQKQGDEAIRKDAGFDDERRKAAFAALERANAAVDDIVGRGHPRGTVAAFAWKDRVETFKIPVTLKDRMVIDRTPYTSPLAMVLEEYERYAVVVVDHKHARIFDYFMGAMKELEAIHDEVEPKTNSGTFKGLEQTRMNHHRDYAVHRHLQRVADRVFAHHKRDAFDKVILAGLPENLTKLERCLHAYLKQRIVAREQWAHDAPREDVRKKTVEVEKQIEATKERKLLALVRDHVCGDLLATTGLDETLRALHYGKVATLVVEDGMTLRGRECPECHVLFPRAEDAKDASSLVPCPNCNRPTRAVPDIIDQAAELAMLSGAKVEHVQYAKDELTGLGRMCSVLRFR